MISSIHDLFHLSLIFLIPRQPRAEVPSHGATLLRCLHEFGVGDSFDFTEPFMLRDRLVFRFLRCHLLFGCDSPLLRRDCFLLARFTTKILGQALGLLSLGLGAKGQASCVNFLRFGWCHWLGSSLGLGGLGFFFCHFLPCLHRRGEHAIRKSIQGQALLVFLLDFLLLRLPLILLHLQLLRGLRSVLFFLFMHSSCLSFEVPKGGARLIGIENIIEVHMRLRLRRLGSSRLGTRCTWRLEVCIELGGRGLHHLGHFLFVCQDALRLRLRDSLGLCESLRFHDWLRLGLGLWNS